MQLAAKALSQIRQETAAIPQPEIPESTASQMTEIINEDGTEGAWVEPPFWAHRWKHIRMLQSPFFASRDPICERPVHSGRPGPAEAAPAIVLTIWKEVSSPSVLPT